MATQEQVKVAIANVLVAMNACEHLGISFQAIVDFRNNQPVPGQITEEQVQEFAASLVS